jgi:Uncharacterized conserved protein, contains double-stranded beta-helix domain
MKIASIYADVVYGDSKPAVKVLVDSNATKEIRIAFKKGQEMEQHKAGFPIVVAVVEGCIDFGVGDERILLEKGMMIALDANVPHDLKAGEDSLVRLTLHKQDSVNRVFGVLNHHP